MALEDVIKTSNPIHAYKYSWMIENVLSIVTKLRGPAITPIPGFSEKVCFELKLSQKDRVLLPKRRTSRNTKTEDEYEYPHCVTLSLINLNCEGKQLNIGSITELFCIDGKKFGEKSVKKFKEFKEETDLFTWTINSDKPNNYYVIYSLMKDYKLIAKGVIFFSGHDLNSSICSIKNNSDALDDLIVDFKSLYVSSSSSDITFSVDDQTLRAHKNILCGRSPVFAKMFDQDMQETKSNNVVIVDANFHEFNCFLMFLYTGRLEDNNWDTVLSLYSLAHKYQVNSLLKICSGILGNGLTVDSVCSVLVLSDLHGDKQLKDAARNFIRANILKVAGTTEWAEIITTKSHIVKDVLG